MGLCVADALGLPVSSYPRDVLDRRPVTGMRAYGTYHQPAGAWSDNTSLTMCLAESLLHGLDYFDIMNHFRKWMFEGEYTPYGTAFGVGNCTAKAVFRYDHGKEPLSCGGTTEGDNGNGSLIRILPTLFFLRSAYGAEWFGQDEAMTIIHNVSKLTHGHKRSWIACSIYLSIADELMNGKNAEEAVHHGIARAYDYYLPLEDYGMDLRYYDRLRQKSFSGLHTGEIRSSGYVVETLEAAIWCLLNTKSYSECALRAVNLGSDTDTVAAVAGSLAGLCYGYGSIPEEWLATIARREYLEDICMRLNEI
jgi:ADP-ribosyl-[dinitrogen reductase] hydrolase